MKQNKDVTRKIWLKYAGIGLIVAMTIHLLNEHVFHVSFFFSEAGIAFGVMVATMQVAVVEAYQAGQQNRQL